jgi:hypothetical protein
MFNPQFNVKPAEPYTFKSKQHHSLITKNLTTVILVVLLIASNFDIIRAQSHDDAICVAGGKMELDYRKKPWKGNNAFLKKYLEQINYFGNEEKVRFLVPVKFWVYRNSEGEGGASFKDIKELMDDLNYYNRLNKTGIQFYLREIKHIDKTSRQVFNYNIEAPLQTILRHTKQALNVYLIDRFTKRAESKKVVKGTYNITTKSIILQRKNSSTGLTHEVGHYFGLLHPHRHYNKGKSNQEPVSRTRTASNNGKGTPLCEIRGDLLKDTPAEPKLTFLVSNDCEFVGTALKDEWGDNYHSDVRNIMSYPTHYTCRDSFTLSQKAVMLYSASVKKFAKYWNTEDLKNEKYFFDANEPNDYYEMASPIKKNVVQEFNFHKTFLSKKEDKTDTCDWHKFEVKSEDNRNVRILITLGNENKQPISASFYDKNLILLSENSSKNNEPIELGCKNVVSDWYYIKVSAKENGSQSTDRYTVEVKLEQ